MPSQTKNKKNNKKNHSRTINKSSKTNKLYYRRKTNKNNTHKTIKILKGGALPIEDLIAIIESELGDIKLDDATKVYYTERYESFKTDKGKEDEFAKIIKEVRNQVQKEKAKNKTRTRNSRNTRNIRNGAAAAVPSRVFSEPNSAMPVFTIITTGLSNWGTENNVINFYGIIMESLIMNTFFGKVASIQVHHYDSNISPEQSELIKQLETSITSNYGIQLKSTIYLKDLEPREITLQSLLGLDTRNYFHLDFANLDENDSFLFINGFPIRKIYFGYWEPSYPQVYTDIIKQIKLMEINPDKSITTFADKLRALGVPRPNLFYPISECEGVPRQVITIPGIRAMYQWGGSNAIDLYKSLWHSSPEVMNKYITNYQKWLDETAFNTLERIKANKTPSEYCDFCPVRQCLDTKFRLNDSRPHPRLCGLCFRLTRDTIGNEMIRNTPPASV